MPARREASCRIGKLRGMIFAVATAEEIGCECSSHAVAAWMAQWDVTLLPGTPIPAELRRAWQQRFAGAQVAPMARNLLYAKLPSLQTVFDNPLWEALNPELTVDTFQARLKSCRINQRPLPKFSVSSLQLLCGSPSWRRLGVLVMMLRCPRFSFYLERLWLRRTFVRYCVLTCLCKQYRPLAVPLYQAIDKLVRADMISQIDGWPSDEAAFVELLARQIALEQRLYELGWVKDGDERCALWLWYLGKPEHRELVNEVFDTPQGLHLPRPQRLYTRVIRAVRQQAGLQITFLNA